MTASGILIFALQGSHEKREREKGTEDLLGKIIGENFPDLRKETYIQAQEAQSPKQDGPKEVHTKIQVNGKN